jgi:hypothetical protein
MTAGFGVLDLTPQTLQDDRFQIGFKTTLLLAVRTAMRRLLAENFRPPRQLQIRQLPGDFITDLGRQVFDIHKRASGRKFLLLALRQRRHKLRNFTPHAIIYDQNSRSHPE